MDHSLVLKESIGKSILIQRDVNRIRRRKCKKNNNLTALKGKAGR